MTAQELKNSILMQAVQGKLVPQDPNDEPASVLLAKIRAEKEQMMKEGKIKKEPISEIYVDPSDNQHYEKVGKTVKCIEDEIPFKLPKGWCWTRYHNILEIIMGQSPDGNSVSESNSGIEFHQGKIYFGSKYIGISSVRTSKPKKIAPANSVLLCVRAPVGISNIADREICIGRGLCALITFGGISEEFIFYQSKTLETYYQSLSTGTTFKAINKDIVANTLIALPPLSEQKRIVNRTKEILPYIKDYELKCKRLKKLDDELPNKLKKSILQYAIEGKLVKQNPDDEPASELIKRIRAEKEKLIKSGKLKKDKNESFIYRGSDNSYYEKFQNGKEVCIDNEIPFEIPQSWAWCRLSYAMSVYGGKRIPAGQKLVTEDTGHKYIRVTDMKNSSVSNSDVHYITNEVYEQIKRYTISCDDLYITVAGTIGKVGNIPIEFDGANLTENANKLITYDLDNDYVKLMMNSAAIQNQITEATTKVGQPKLAIMRIKSLLIPLPPIAEQQRIVSKIKECLNLLK